jgi:hypothetical protein
VALPTPSMALSRPEKVSGLCMIFFLRLYEKRPSTSSSTSSDLAGQRCTALFRLSSVISGSVGDR